MLQLVMIVKRLRLLGARIDKLLSISFKQLINFVIGNTQFAQRVANNPVC